MKRPNKIVYSCLSIIVVFIVATWKIIFSPGLILYGDFLSTLSIERFINTMYPLWDQYGSFPTFEQLPRLVYRYPLYIVSKIVHIATGGYFKILFLGTPLVAGILMCLVSWDLIFKRKETLNSLLGSFLAGLFYMLNPWAVQRMHQQAFLLGYAITPLIVWGTLKSIKTGRLKYQIITAVALLLSAATPHYLIFNFAIFVSVVGLEYILKNINLVESIRIILKTTLIFTFMSSYWAVPYIGTLLHGNLAPEYSVSKNIVDVLSRNSSILNVLRLVSTWFVRTPYKPNNPLLSSLWDLVSVLLFALILAIPVLSISRNKLEREDSKYILFGLTVISITLILSTGTKIYDSYTYLVFDIPFGWIFRGPNKLVGILAFGYALLIALIFKTNWTPNKKRTLGTFVILTLLFTAYTLPNDRGFFTKVYIPSNLPNEFYTLQENIPNIGDRALYLSLAHPFEIRLFDWGKVAVLDTLSSSIPAFSSFSPYSNPFVEYLYYRLLNNGTTHLGEHLSAVGVDVLVYHNRTINNLIYPNFPGYKFNEIRAKKEEGVLNGIENQQSLNLIYHEGEVYVFKNKIPTRRVYITENPILISDDLQLLESLKYTNETTSGILFEDELIWKTLPLHYVDTVILNPINPIFDFVPDYKKKIILISPAKFTAEHDLNVWSRGYFNDPAYGTWHYAPLGVVGIDNWQFDYGYGFAYTSGINETLNMTFKAPPGNYVMLVRYLKSTKGGRIKINILNTTKVINTFSNWDRFVWENIGTIKIPSNGNNDRLKMSIENINGFNAINMIVLVPENTFQEIMHNITAKLRAKQIEYIIEPENYYTNYAVKIHNASNGLAVMYSSIHIPIDIIKNASYKIYIRVYSPTPTNITLGIDNSSKQITVQNWTVSSILVPLNGGRHYIKIKAENINTNILPNPSFEEVNKGYPAYWTKPAKGYIAKVSSDSIDGSYSLEVISNTTHGWSWVYSKPISVHPNSKYRISLEIKYYNTKTTHVKVIGFNNSTKRWVEVAFIVRGIEGTDPNWTKVSKIIVIPKNITKIKLALNAGPPLNPNSGTSRVYFDNVTVSPLKQVPYIDLIWVKEINNDSLNKDKISKSHIISIHQKDSTIWHINIMSYSPTMLVFTESYDPLWEAKVYKDGKLVEKVKPVPAYGVINGFWINQTGNLTIVLRYTPQDWFELGLKISLTTFILSIFYIIYDWRREKGDKWARKLEGIFAKITTAIKRRIRNVIRGVIGK